MSPARFFFTQTYPSGYTTSAMKAEFPRLTPAEACEEAERGSLAIGIAGWVVIAAVQTSGAIPSV